MRILVELSARLGEVINDIVLMRTLEHGIPGCHIEVIVLDYMAGVIEDCSFIQRRNILIAGNLASSLKVNLHIGLGKWDAFFQLTPESRIELARLKMNPSLVRDLGDCDSKTVNEGRMMHRLSILNGIVPQWQDHIQMGIPLLETRAEHVKRIVGLKGGERVLTIAPGSSTGKNLWPLGTAIATINDLQEHFDRVLVLGRARDNEHCKRIAHAVEVTSIAGDLPLPYALALFTLAQLHVGSDNCMAHVAAAFGTPTLCVGGQQDQYDRPWNQTMLAGKPETITTETVLQRAHALLA